MVGRRPQHVVSKWPCLVVSSAISCCSSICPGRLSTAWLVSLVVFSCHVVSKWWRAGSTGRLWGGWYALPRTISFFSQCRLYLWVLSSPWPRCWSFYLCMWCWACFFPFWSVRPQVCSVLVWQFPEYPRNQVTATLGNDASAVNSLRTPQRIMRHERTRTAAERMGGGDS